MKKTICLLLVLCAALTFAPAALAEYVTPTDIRFEQKATPTDILTSDGGQQNGNGQQNAGGAQTETGKEELPKATPTDITFERPPATPTDVKPATPTNVPSNGKPPATPTDIKPPKDGDKPGKPGKDASPTDLPEPASPIPSSSTDIYERDESDLDGALEGFFARLIKAIVNAIKKFFAAIFGIKIK